MTKVQVKPLYHDTRAAGAWRLEDVTVIVGLKHGRSQFNGGVVATGSPIVPVSELAVGVPGPVGPPGATAADVSREVLTFPFAFGDAPQTIHTMPHAGRVVEAAVSYRAALNGAAPAVRLGHNATSDSILAAADSDPTQAGQWAVAPDLDLTFNDTVRLAITPDGSTQGAGVVRLTISYEDS